jgi:hypothetical protein
MEAAKRSSFDRSGATVIIHSIPTNSMFSTEDVPDHPFEVSGILQGKIKVCRSIVGCRLECNEEIILDCTIARKFDKASWRVHW